jgi:Spy/CpxP family protein refolding chaperone
VQPTCQTCGIIGQKRVEEEPFDLPFRDEIKPLVKAVIAKKRALKELVLGEDPDPAAIRQASADLGNVIAEAAVLGSSLAQEAKSILAPEQLTRLREMRQNRQKAFDKSLREWQERNPAF